MKAQAPSENQGPKHCLAIPRKGKTSKESHHDLKGVAVTPNPIRLTICLNALRRIIGQSSPNATTASLWALKPVAFSTETPLHCSQPLVLVSYDISLTLAFCTAQNFLNTSTVTPSGNVRAPSNQSDPHP